MPDENETGRQPAADERFEEGASVYADYLRTAEGRLRLDLAWANLREFVDAEFLSGVGSEYEGRALDAGGGTGALALRLAAEGWEVAVADSSAAMLALAEEAARREGLAGRMTFHQTDAARLGETFGPGSFDLAVCHNVLEYVDDPAAVARALAACVREGGIVSALARNRAGEVMRSAVKNRDLDAARAALTAESVRESLYGGPARLFDRGSLAALFERASFATLGARGVRVVADYLPPELTDSPEAYARLVAFEAELGARPEFAAVARYVQLFGRRT
jgi:S-adenosylmethionine-dependent methyltransferase